MGGARAPTLVAHVETWRPYTLCYVGLVSLAGALLAADDPPAWRLAGAWAAPTLGWLAGLYGGDYFDRDLDAVAKPHRPIPSGRLRPQVALAAMCGCIAAAFAITAVLAPWALALALVTAVAGIGYSTVFKKRGLSGNAVRGGLMSAAFLYGAMATTDHLSGWLLACAAVFWLHDAGTNLIGAIRDIDGDRAGGYLTAPVRHGRAAAVRWAVACWLGWSATAVVAFLAKPESGTGAWVLLGLAAAAGIAAVHQVVVADTDGLREAALRAHEVLVIERLMLASAFIAVAAGAAAALTAATATAAATVLAQRGLRRRHELGVRPREGALPREGGQPQEGGQ
jgi:geranylgeranylglycerol-phosphate geranylgeranyltransferase